MDIFTDVSDSAYLPGTIFFYPRENDNVKALAVYQQTGQYLIALYSILFTLIAMEAWQLATILVMSFHNVPELVNPTEERTKRLGIAMAGFWNAREPLNAVFFTTNYLLKAYRRELSGVTSYVFGLFLLSLLGVATTYVSSIFVAGKLVLAAAAPARLSQVFIPTIPNQMTNYDTLRLQALRAPAALRAIGSAEAASVTVRNTVKFDRHQRVSTGSTDSKPPDGFTYEYSVTGADMGLQKYSKLRQDVMGECVTAYDWYDGQQGDFDVYRPWGVKNTTIKVPRSGEANSAPRVQAIVFPYDERSDPREVLPANNTYGLFVFSAGRKSYRGSSDIWYSTQPAEGNTSIADAPTLVVRPQRPALSCWQQDSWVYNGKKYKNIYELSDPSEINFPQAWFKLLQLEFSQPRIVQVANSAGPSALVSSMTYYGGSFDAESSTFEKDIVRLLVASRISSVHVFRDSVMVGEKQNFANGAIGPNGDPEKSTADFVVTTPQVLALRFSILLAVPLTLVIMFIVLVVVQLFKRGELRQKLAWYEAPYLYARGDELHQSYDNRHPYEKDPRPAPKPNTWGTILKDPLSIPPPPAHAPRSQGSTQQWLAGGYLV